MFLSEEHHVSCFTDPSCHWSLSGGGDPFRSVSGCYFSSSIFSGNCGSLVELNCESGAPSNDSHFLSGLTVGSTYYIQVSYSPGGPCAPEGYAEFCISVQESGCVGGNNNNCIDAQAFCTGLVQSFCNSTGVPSSGSASCLFSTQDLISSPG